MTDQTEPAGAELLRHAAALAKESGKARTAEWLRTCATLPPAEWPPAPAYKGPMVPAAERDRLSLMLRAMARKLVTYRRWADGDVPTVHKLRAEVREHQVAAASLYSRVFAALGLGITAPWHGLVDAAAKVRAERDRHLATIADTVHLLRNAGVIHGEGLAARVQNLIAERDQLQARIGKALELAYNPAPWIGIEDEFAEAVLTALQGGQPAEPASPQAWTQATPSVQASVQAQPDARTARSGSTPQGIPAELASTVDSDEDVAKYIDMRTTSDCLRACLATVTGRSYEDAPDDTGDWRAKAIEFINTRQTIGLVIGIGESPRGCKGGHAIVCYPDGTLVHDPHPSRAGVVTMWELWDEAGRIAVDQICDDTPIHVICSKHCPDGCGGHLICDPCFQLGIQRDLIREVPDA